MKKALRYPGSKWNIAARIVEFIPKHHSYVEPFFGSGAVFFNKAPSDIETVNDLDSDVTNLFQCIQKDPERLAWLLATTPFSREVYDSQFTGGSEMYNGYLQGWHKKYFKSCAEQGRPRTEVLWMNYWIGQMDIRDFIDEENKVCN